MDECTKTMRRSFMKQTVSNAENARALWQVGKSGEFGDNNQFLDKALLTEMLTGEKNSIIELQFASVAKFAAQPVDMKQFLIVINPDSVLKTENLSFERISVRSAAFSSARAPESGTLTSSRRSRHLDRRAKVLQLTWTLCHC
ncbi:uncharacterized protein RCO7_14855 [Rhynchosporium graminicola]|uniref:Uncharacterized protein n=1 Tax=Rhynchosporium graminicola TaxID=2792576 RepID=A0A1E1L634_9HELO|nr:uncharacterized protein RCO7_14855 [Rhynchosporium commune]